MIPHRMKRVAYALGLTLTLALPATASDRSGTFKNIEGSVTVIRNAKSLPAVPGGKLLVADRMVTGPDSAASVTLRDGTVVSVGSNSKLDLNQFVFDTTSQNGNMLLNLLQGTMRMVTGIMGKTNPDLIKVTTPTSVVGVRGTDFIVEVLP